MATASNKRACLRGYVTICLLFAFHMQACDAADIQNQRHATVAQNCSACYTWHLAEVGFQIFDDNLLLAKQFVDDQANRRPWSSTITSSRLVVASN